MNLVYHLTRLRGKEFDLWTHAAGCNPRTYIYRFETINQNFRTHLAEIEQWTINKIHKSFV